MSKKIENESYVQGMAAGSAPYEAKFEEHAQKLNIVQKNIQHGMNCIDEAMDEIIDAYEEHDERISNIENADYTSIANLNAEEKKIFAELLKMIACKFQLKMYQIEFMASIFKVLGIDYDETQECEIEKINKITNTNAQKVIYKVLCELMFLENETTEYTVAFEGICEYFDVGKIAKNAILGQIETTFMTLGKEKFRTKYSRVEEVKPKKKNYPKLEVDTTKFKFYEKEVFTYQLDEFDKEDLFERFFRNESSCRNAYAEQLREPLNLRDSYIREGSGNFIGTGITDCYALQIESYINEIYDYVNIHKVRMDISDLLELRDNCRKDIFDYTKKVIKEVEPSYRMKSFDYYKDMLDIEEYEDYVDTFFGGMKKVTRYILSYEGERDTFWAMERMAEEITLYISAVTHEVSMMVLKKYNARIRDCVNQINQMLGNVDDFESKEASGRHS